jgi:hypothetical protein
MNNRYGLKWSNGYWKVFDFVEYTDKVLCLTKKEAEVIIDKFNQGK